MIKLFKKIKSYYITGRDILTDSRYVFGTQANTREMLKTPSRTEIINFLIKNKIPKETYYLEIGVRNPDENFNHIKATHKYGVDPGVEFKTNPVEFKLTSDVFFEKKKNGELLNNIFFDVVFIDGLHLAEQVERDINNALEHIKEDGFIVVHDCNPPTEFHARYDYQYYYSPATDRWNGTVWKSFFKFRFKDSISCCCIDSDWGVGIIFKKKIFDNLTENFNPYFEYHIFNERRKESLNLMSFDDFKKKFNELF
jgi:hypothetical protein